MMMHFKLLLSLLLLAATTVSVVVAKGIETKNAVRSNGDCAIQCSSSKTEPAPLRVFILAGQSNMVGQGNMTHLEQLLNDTSTHDEYSHLWNESSNSWAERDDVYCKFDSHVGKLSAGFGSHYAHGRRFGPELGFGTVVGNAACHCEQDRPSILLLKTAWGGKDLAVDFRPPRSHMGDYMDIESWKYGVFYRQMMKDIFATLSDLSKVVPGYSSQQGYKLEGFVFFQGWNDMIDEKKVAEYESNLANLIRDVRDGLKEQNLPFLVGELGQGGTRVQGDGGLRMLRMRKAERSVTQMKEFRDNTLFVPTAKYVVDNGETFNGRYHYDGRADTFYRIGEAMGRGMLELLAAQEEPGHRMLRSRKA